MSLMPPELMGCGPDLLDPDERRLALLLTTRLSLRQIADILDVERDTVLSESVELYRKLGICGDVDENRRPIWSG